MKGRAVLKSLSVPAIAILLSLAAFAAIVLLTGKNPAVAFIGILEGSGWLPRSGYPLGSGQLTDVFRTLDALTPMMFASLAVAVAFRGGLFNIGVSGQMLFAGFVSTVTIGYSGLPSSAAFPLVIFVGASSGALAGGLIGLLKCRFNVNEVVSSIMLNFIFQYVISFFINTSYIDPVSRHSAAVGKDVCLTLTDVFIGGYIFRIPWALAIALACAVLTLVFFTKSVRGFEMAAVGKNTRAARYAGMSVERNILVTMFLSGAFAGLAGVTYYLGYYDSIMPGTLSPMGFDAIATASLGNMHPIGIIAAGVLVTSLGQGSTYMSNIAGVRPEIASLVIGLILLFSACSYYIKYRLEGGAALRVGKKARGGKMAMNTAAAENEALEDGRSGKEAGKT
ncbi:MAG: ABC transporter permease [Clostridiales Family XIII bacterium]|nr:ABC transporter permease [Clostridiales Family XIII bacterium]